MSVGWSIFGMIAVAVISGGTAMLVNYLKDRSNERRWNRDEVIKGLKDQTATTVTAYQLQLDHAMQEEQEAIARAERAEERAERIEIRAQARVSEAERLAEARKKAYDELRSEAHSERTVWRNTQAEWARLQLRREKERADAQERWDRERAELTSRVAAVETRMIRMDELFQRCLQTCAHQDACELVASVSSEATPGVRGGT